MRLGEHDFETPARDDFKTTPRSDHLQCDKQVRHQGKGHSTTMLAESATANGMQRAEFTHYDRLKDYILG